MLRIFGATQVTVGCDGLVADDAGVLIDWTGVNPARIEIALGPSHKKSASNLYPVESFEVDIGPVHGIESAGFDEQRIEDIDIVILAIGDVDKAGNMTFQIDQGMHLDS